MRGVGAAPLQRTTPDSASLQGPGKIVVVVTAARKGKG